MNPGAATGVATRLEVIREAQGGGQPRTVVGESDLQANIAAHNALAFPTRIPVQAGDLIGLELQPPTAIACVGAGIPGDLTLQSPDPGPGNDLPVTLIQGNFRMDVAATVEPDGDQDGFGDETQDACPGVFGSVSGCPRADLSVTQTAARGSESDLVTFTVIAQNNGPDPLLGSLNGAIVSESLRPPFTAGLPCFQERFGFNPCPLDRGGSATIQFVARLKAGVHTDTATISDGTLQLAATKATGAGDPNPANNTDNTTISVVAPAVSSAKAVPSVFRLASLLPKFTRRPPVGTTIRFKLSEPSRPTLTFSQPKIGRKVGRRCVATTRTNRRKPRCTIPNVRGSLAFNGHAGTNKVRFQGRLSRTKRLKPGRYTLTITATDSAGNRSNAKTTSFTIVRG
jgi:hypothetical protein